MPTQAHDTSLAPQPLEPPPGCPFEPPTELTRLRTEAPISKVALHDGTWAWLVTRHADIRAVLGDHEHFSSMTTAPGYPVSGMTGGEVASTSGGLIRMDPPEHTRLRHMVTKEFMVKRIATLEPSIEAFTEQLCDAMDHAERPVDLVKALALPLPSLVISLLLGVPDEDHATFQHLTGVLLSRTTNPKQHLAAGRELVDYLDRLVASKQEHPGEDILGRLIVDEGQLTHRELVAFAGILLVAGHETTANMIGLSALTLMRDPELAQRLRDDPALIPGAVEELLRFHSIIRNGPRRAVLADTEVGGQLFRAGEGVIVAIHSANRDPEAFSDPDRLDITRPNAQHHVAFGYGIHGCLGQSLARAELRIVIEGLLRRYPTMRLAVPLEDVPFRSDMTIYGAHELPVTW